MQIVKLKGKYIWYHRATEDALFLVVKESLMIPLCNGKAGLREGEFIVVLAAV